MWLGWLWTINNKNWGCYSPAPPGWAQSDPTSTDQTFCTTQTWAGPSPVSEQYFMFSKFVPEWNLSFSLSLSHRQAIRYRLGPILNRALMRSPIVVCKYLTIVTCLSCEGQTDQTPDLTWTPSSRGEVGGHRLVFSNLFLSRYSSGFCLHSPLLQ